MLDAAPRTEPVERQIALDMARRGAMAAPLLIGVSTAIWGIDGGISSAFAILLALANLLAAALLLEWAANISLAAIAAAALGGYVLRLVLLTVAVFAVRHQSWVSWLPLAFTLAITHLGLLIWETRHVSASLAYPGLKPRKGR